MFGLKTPAEGGGSAPALKPTRFMSNSWVMLEGLAKECNKLHQHQHLMSGRAAAAAYYPLPLLKAILQGIAATKDAISAANSLAEGE